MEKEVAFLIDGKFLSAMLESLGHIRSSRANQLGFQENGLVRTFVGPDLFRELHTNNTPQARRSGLVRLQPPAAPAISY